MERFELFVRAHDHSQALLDRIEVGTRNREIGFGKRDRNWG
jgi:hypothetical protein